MSTGYVVDRIIDYLYQWITNYKDREVIKDTTQLSCKYDCYIDSSVTNPLSFTVFPLTEKNEIVIDDKKRIITSEAAYFLFVNPKRKTMVAVKNNLKNQKKLIKKENFDFFSVKVFD